MAIFDTSNDGAFALAALGADLLVFQCVVCCY